MVDSRYILTLYPLNNKVKEKVCVKNMQLSDSIREIKGIGEKSEKLFAKLGISTVAVSYTHLTLPTTERV